MKIKRDPRDILFAQIIKYRDKRCVRCLRADGKLECSHIYSRRHKGTRWDEDNAKLLCFKCHRWWHENPFEAVEWVRSWMGERRYNALRMRASKITKFTKHDLEIIKQELKERLAELKGG